MTEYKQAEQKVFEWLDRPQDGYCIDRIPDQMTGFYGSKNISDFILFKSPNLYYIESKATWHDRFDFTLITEYQWEEIYKKSRIDNVYGWIIILYLTYKRAFILDIQDIRRLSDNGIKSLNIKKVDKWDLKYFEIPTIKSRKTLLDYDKNIDINDVLHIINIYKI